MSRRTSRLSAMLSRLTYSIGRSAGGYNSEFAGDSMSRPYIFEWLDVLARANDDAALPQFAAANIAG